MPNMGLRTLLLENICYVIILQFVGHTAWAIGFDYVRSVPLLLSGYVFRCRIFFSFGLFISGYSAVCLILVIFWKEVSYSTTLSPIQIFTLNITLKHYIFNLIFHLMFPPYFNF